MRHGFAYLFERFPSYLQLFCYREASEMLHQGMHPQIYSIREAEELPDAPLALPGGASTLYLPDKEGLRKEVRQLAADRRIPKTLLPQLQTWGDAPDKRRLYEAAWLGPRLRSAGIHHVHCHFAGIAARTCFWLKRFFRISFSFTGHANDIFCTTESPVTKDDLIEQARLIATVSVFSAGQLRTQYPSAARKIHSVYNGIDVDAIPTAHPAQARPTILSVGRLVEKKGYPILIEACRSLKEWGVPHECLIVGEGPLREELEGQITRLGLQSSVRLLGAQPAEAIHGLLRESRLFALACVREHDGGMDNLPTVITEAMAAALPVVSTRLAGIPEQVRHQETGLLVEPGEPEPFAEALRELLENPSRCCEMGKAGQLRARQFFSLQHTTRRLARLLTRYGRITPPWRAIGRDRQLAWQYLRRLCLPLA
ncbi:MAG: glycosyltransferase family 4 protein [Verrucomicrobiia bacterium]